MWTQTQHEVDEHLHSHRINPDVLCVHADGMPAFLVVARPPRSELVRKRTEAAERLKQAFRDYRALTAA